VGTFDHSELNYIQSSLPFQKPKNLRRSKCDLVKNLEVNIPFVATSRGTNAIALVYTHAQ